MTSKQNDDENQPIIWSVGHSNKTYSELASLLKSAEIQTVIDCRTKPRSRFAQFNGNRLAESLAADGMTYEWRGANLGGLAGNVFFGETLDEIAQRSTEGERIALLCSEGKWQDCHRGTILAPQLEARGVTVKHLLYPTPQKALL